MHIDPEEITPEPGAYRLWLRLPEAVRVPIGALGERELPAGLYAYSGSARRGIRGRVRRYLRPTGVLKWHIDHLLPHAQVVDLEALPGGGPGECALHAELLAIPGSAEPVRGFGSSDCRCGSHLALLPPGSPAPAVAHTRLRTGEEMTVRLLRPDDSPRLGAYFAGLSERTRSLYGPHPFTQEEADAICATLDPADMLRVVGELPDGRLISYMLLQIGVRHIDAEKYRAQGIELPEGGCAAFAPSVLDGLQETGVGTAMAGVLFRMARSRGIRTVNLWGGVQERNTRARRFYEKLGFQKIGEFMAGDLNNYDMVCPLNT